MGLIQINVAIGKLPSGVVGTGEEIEERTEGKNMRPWKDEVLTLTRHL